MDNLRGVSDLECLACAIIPGITLNRLWRKKREYEISRGCIPGKDMDILMPVASYAIEGIKIFLYGALIYETFLKS